MEKLIKTFEVVYPLEWQYGGSISQIKKDIEELEKLGVTHIDIDAEFEHYNAYVVIKALSQRLETDEECTLRIDKETKDREQIKQRDLEELERLKLKYNL